MSDVNVMINRRSYQIACDDGQEDHLRGLAALVDQRVDELVSTMGQIGDQRLLVMASLLLADEVQDVRKNLDQAQDKLDTTASGTNAERQAVTALEGTAAKIEALAGAIERD